MVFVTFDVVLPCGGKGAIQPVMRQDSIWYSFAGRWRRHLHLLMDRMLILAEHSVFLKESH